MESEKSEGLEKGTDQLVLDRLKQAIKKSGGAHVVSEMAGIPLGTLTKNLSGNTKISFETVVRITEALKLDFVSLFSETNELNKITEDFDLIIEIGKIVKSAYAAAGIRLSGTTEIAEINALHKELVNTVRDISQTAIVKAVLPELEKGLERRLSEAKSNPGTGKQEAS